MKDINLLTRAYGSIAPASITATTSSEGVVDLADVESILVVVNVGVVTTADSSNYFTFEFFTGANSDGSGATAVAAGAYLDPKDQNGNTWDRLINATTEGPLTYQFGVINLRNDRYGFVRATETSTASAVFGAVVVTSSRRHNAATS